MRFFWQTKSENPRCRDNHSPKTSGSIVAGGKYDFTAKWWNPACYQQVVDHFRGKIAFVQCGEAGHWHPPLNNVINLVGKTTLRQFIRLMHHAAGVVCPVTFAMHLAAAVEPSRGARKKRPCVVIAGGREPTHWEAYPHHQYISTVGALECCLEGGCWKSRCQLVGDGDEKDRNNICEQPVQITPNLRIPRCHDMITAADVIRRIELYCEGGVKNGHPQPTTHATANTLNTDHATGHAVEVAPRRTVTEKAEIPNRPAATAKGCSMPTPIVARAPIRLPKPKPQQVLLEFRHGLGDGVQVTIVLRHLRHFHPEWEVDLAALRGKHSVGRDLCRNQLILGQVIRRNDYDQIFTLDWHECSQAHARWPSTKPTRCLLDVFHLEPDLDLCQYQISRSPEAMGRACDYLASVSPAATHVQGRFPVVLLHYQGNTSGDKKDLNHAVIRQVCDVIRETGFVPVILDWDRRSPLVDQKSIFNPGADHPLWSGHGTGDAEILAALIESSSLMIGIDSGPLHVAGATTTPTLGVWTRHHPVHYFDLASNVRHLVPHNHRSLAAGSAALEFFDQHYHHDTYDDLATELVAQVRSQLTGQPIVRVSSPNESPKSPRLTAVQYDRQYYEEHRRAGLDYLGYGDWQRDYGRWLVDALQMRGKQVLDVGCACGSILRGLGEAGAVTQGIDLSEYMIELGRQKWPDMASLLHVADAADLHRFGDAGWHLLHSAQVAEHWPPAQVPAILRELARITVPGGLFFCSFDTEELFARQGRTMETEDPTHICIRPRAWWLEQLAATGWQDVTDEMTPILRSHPRSYLRRYDWDYFVARKASQELSLPAAPYDLARYPEQIWDCPSGSIDRRHLFWMYDILASGLFRQALEIGCLNGVSSTAFLEAIRCQALPKATFCDLEFRPSWTAARDCCPFPDRIDQFEGRSVDLLRQENEFDFIFVDGDHRLETVREEVECLLRRRPLCVMAHDTNAQACGFANCDGPPLLKWRFQTTAGYLCLEDSIARPGEATQRGLFLATTSPAVLEVARSSLEKWGALGPIRPD